MKDYRFKNPTSYFNFHYTCFRINHSEYKYVRNYEANRICKAAKQIKSGNTFLIKDANKFLNNFFKTNIKYTSIEKLSSEEELQHLIDNFFIWLEKNLGNHNWFRKMDGEEKAFYKYWEEIKGLESSFSYDSGMPWHYKIFYTYLGDERRRKYLHK